VKAKKDGKALQRLIRSIESALAAGNASIEVEMEKRFHDKVTGKPREHDVVLTIRNQHHEMVIALECRDRSRPVGVDAVEAFHSKCRDTGIHSGIIVSGKAFCKTALKKAAHYNIECLSLDEAERFNWCETPVIESRNRQIHHTHLFLSFPEGTEVKQETIQTEGGTLVTELATQWGVNALSGYHPMPMEEPGEHRVGFLDPNPKVYSIHDGKRVQAVEARLVVDYTVSVESSPLSFRTYMDVGKSKPITQAAVGKVMLSKDETADMVLSTNDKGEINITLVRAPTALTGTKTPAT